VPLLTPNPGDATAYSLQNILGWKTEKLEATQAGQGSSIFSAIAEFFCVPAISIY